MVLLLPRSAVLVLPFAGLVVLTACSPHLASGAAGSGASATEATTLSRLPVAAYHGRLVDVYGQRAGEPAVLELFRRDVLVGYQLPDADAPDSLFELHGVSPGSLQPRIVVRRPINSPGFEAAVAALRAGRSQLVPASTGMVVPRDAAFELVFAAELGAVEPDAVELVDRELTARLPARLSARGASLVVDPVLLADEARRLAVADTAAMPLARRLVLRTRSGSELADFRTGVAAAALLPLRLVGHLPFLLERVDPAGPRGQWVTLFKAGIVHETDRGDGLMITPAGGNVSAVVTEIIAEPRADNGRPAVQHVRALVPRTRGLEQNDPSNLPGYPSNPQSPAGEAWLIQNAPRAVLVADFLAERQRDDGTLYGDDPRYFMPFVPAPLAAGPGLPGAPNENVSPFAGMLLRFSAPVALSTARPLDTMFFATRDLLDPASQRAFIRSRGIDPNSFIDAKYRTPHLVASRLLDVSGGRTTLRLQPPLGFYLDDAMRQVDEGVSFAQKRFRYFAHLVGGDAGVAGLDGEALDLGAEFSQRQELVVPFALDTSSNAAGRPTFPDNLAVSVVRRFADADEDEQPSYYLSDEVQGSGAFNPLAFNLQDLFGAVSHLAGGKLAGRSVARVRKVVDNLNQQPAPPQFTPQQYCPSTLSGEQQYAVASASVRFGAPLQNPLNPHGARLQAAWREIDMSLSRTDPDDLNLDVEQMYWGAFAGAPIQNDRFEGVSLYLGTSEHRPEPCVGLFSALPTMPASGLGTVFADNYVANTNTSGAVGSSPSPHPAFVDRSWTIDPRHAVADPTGTYLYLELPEFQEPHFVWRDETAKEQGGTSRRGSDVDKSTYASYILSPFLAGQGRFVTSVSGQPSFNWGFWNNQQEFMLSQPNRLDPFTGGSVGAIGLPLMVDFQTLPSPSTMGVNGSQVSLSVQSSPNPAFRAYSSGGLVGGQQVLVNPASAAWQTATGGFTPSGARTRASDNSVFWVMADFLKRTSVATAGFVDLVDPHRMASPRVDPRLGPYRAGGRGGITFVYDAPGADTLLPGTSVSVEFRGAGAVDPQAWRAAVDGYPEAPSEKNFPLDPLKAGDAHLRKFDDRPVAGTPRNYWTHYYNKNVTDYTDDVADLTDPTFTSQFAGPNEQFQPRDVRYVNWRLVMQADTATGKAPEVDSFWLAYRLQ